MLRHENVCQALLIRKNSKSHSKFALKFASNYHTEQFIADKWTTYIFRIKTVEREALKFTKLFFKYKKYIIIINSFSKT